MIFFLWMWWQGYLTLRLQGQGLERFLNQVATAQIPLWRAERLTADVIVVRVPVRAFAKLRPLLWESLIKVNILDRHGLPFLVSKLRLRAFWAVGLVLALLFMVYLSSFIWFVEVVGNEQISAEQLWEVLEAEGLRTGIRRQNLASGQLETTLLTRFPILAWVQVSLQGVKVVINLAEREDLPGEEQGPGDIYAVVDGLITEILVLRGTPLVKERDTVRTGDLLISGDYYDVRGRKQNGAAQGIVLARVWYQGVGEAPFTIWEPVRTGKTHLQFLITVGSLTLPLGKSYPHTTHFATTQEWCLSLGSAMLPLKWTRVEYEEVVYISRSISFEQARELARERAWESLLGRGIDPQKVQDERIEEARLVDDEGIHITLWVEVEEDIGRFVPQ